MLDTKVQGYSYLRGQPEAPRFLPRDKVAVIFKDARGLTKRAAGEVSQVSVEYLPKIGDPDVILSRVTYTVLYRKKPGGIFLLVTASGDNIIADPSGPAS